MERQFRFVFDPDIKDAITDLQAETSKFKKKLFNSILRNEALEPVHIKRYLSVIEEFVKYWDWYSTELATKMRSASGKEGVTTIETPFIKEYIYAKYDFASMLQFADGLVRGVTDGKFLHVEDIEDFKDHTIDKAFDGLPGDIGSVLDRVINSKMGIEFDHRTDKSDASTYNTIKTYKMFDPRSRVELYKAADKTVSFITHDLRYGNFPRRDNLKIFVSMVNNIIDYITYSLTAYACRIFIISRYAYSFIHCRGDCEDADYSESTDGSKSLSADNAEESSKSSDSNIEVTIMRDADDQLAKDVNKCEDFFKVFEEFIAAIGADSLFQHGHKPKFVNGNACGGGYSDDTDNIFRKKLLDNQIENEIFSHWVSLIPYNVTGKDITELNHLIKSYIYNSSQGIQGTSTPKQELFHVIRGADNGNTVADLQVLAKDLYTYSFHSLVKIRATIEDLRGWVNKELNEDRVGMSSMNSASETLQILNEFYGDIALVIIQKARDIEMKINDARNATIAKTIDMCTFKIPDLVKSDTCTNNNMMMAVSDTTRVPIDLIDVYSTPAFESMELNDELLRYLPEFADDVYFSEAFNISQVLNAMVSKLKAIKKSMSDFFDNQQTKAARKWVVDRKQALLTMNLRGSQLQVYPYKINVTLPRGFDNLVNNLGNIPDKAFESEDELEKWIKSLYPNDTIYGWFRDGNNGALKYRNLFLFQDEKDPVDDKHHEVLVNIGDTQIAKNFGGWIETIEKSEQLYRQLLDLQGKIENGVNSLKAKAAAATNKINAQKNNGTAIGESVYTEADEGNDKQASSQSPISAQSAGSSDNAAGDAGKNASTTNPPAQNSSNPSNTDSASKKTPEPDNGASLVNRAISEADKVIAQIYAPLTPMIVEYIKAEYRYMKTVYSQLKKS